MAAAAGAGQFPEPGEPEVAFLGRSNVGKSSLLNRLVGRRSLARTSSAPGKTRLLHWYRVVRASGETWLVDLPGYGYAKVSRSERARWRPLIESYLEARTTLRTAVLLQDLRREWAEDERLLLEWLVERRIPVLVALTKSDKLKPMRRAQRVRGLRAEIGSSPAAVIATSATRGTGIVELWRAIDEGRGGGPGAVG
jgi:GTP-binding protein